MILKLVDLFDFCILLFIVGDTQVSLSLKVIGNYLKNKLLKIAVR